jgi:hypothetical protein
MKDKFENWLKSISEKLINEDVAEVATDTIATDTATAQPDNRDGIISDVDAIMNSLDALSIELKEHLQINEDLLDKAIGTAAVAGTAAIAGLGLAAKKAYDYKIVAPKAKKAQDTVNKMSIKIAGIEVKLDAAEGDMKDKIKAKIEASKEQRDSLQKSIDDKFGEKSSTVQKALSISKKEGRMSVLGIKMGDGTPEQKAEAKAQLAKLKTSIVQDEADFRNAKPSEEAVADLKSAIDKEEKEKTPEDSKEDDESTEKPEKNSKEGQLERINKLIGKEKDRMEKANIDESPMMKKLKGILDKVSSKESWQLRGTTLGVLFEMEISKLEADCIITESTSVRERFSRLL